MMTVSELERYAKILPGPDEVAEMVLALIADWRAMREYISRKGMNHGNLLARQILEGLKVKP